MKELEKLLDRIIQRININLRELNYDVSPFIKNLIQWHQIFDKRGYVVIKLTQIDIVSLNNPVQELFQFFHDSSLLWYLRNYFPACPG